MCISFLVRIAWDNKAALWYICNGDLSRSCRIEVS